MERFYEIKDSKLYNINIELEKWEKLKDHSHLIIKLLSYDGVCIINSFKNKCVVMRKKIWDNQIFPMSVLKMLMKENEILQNEDIPTQIRQELDNSITFIFVLSYKCNLRCTYCYQQWNEELDKKQITWEKLEEILDVILIYHQENPEKYIRLGLFGGEPLINENRKMIIKIFEFAAKYGFTMHITTNGVNLRSYLKELIIYRGLNMTVHTTIDSIVSNEITRTALKGNQINNKSIRILECILFLLKNNVNVVVECNIDAHNINEIKNMFEFYEKEGFFKYSNFHFGLGRVDDRLFEIDYPNIVEDVEILKMMGQIKNIPPNAYVAFIKTSYELCKKIGISYHQHELKNPSNYCWASAPIDNVFYIDGDLDTYRCTYTVGRKEYSLFKFSSEMLKTYQLPNRTFKAYVKCSSCKIGGYCGGGCRLSAEKNFELQCKQERETFAIFLEQIFVPFVDKIWMENI